MECGLERGEASSKHSSVRHRWVRCGFFVKIDLGADVADSTEFLGQLVNVLN